MLRISNFSGDQIKIANDRENFYKNLPQLIQAGATLNSQPRRVIKCSLWHPCKRMFCDGCMSRRRHYFVEEGAKFVRSKGVDRFSTVSWPLQKGEEPWGKLSHLVPKLSKNLSGHLGPFIRTIGIGDKRTPHLHCLVKQSGNLFLERYSKNNGPGETSFNSKAIYDLEGLLGYIFDHNFLDAHLDSERPKRTKVLTCSRGFRVGYPPKQYWLDCKNRGEDHE